MANIVQFLLITIAVFGAVLAKGFWSTLFVVLSGGLWGLYLVAEWVATKYIL
jgi:hypothetical protein